MILHQQIHSQIASHRQDSSCRSENNNAVVREAIVRRFTGKAIQLRQQKSFAAEYRSLLEDISNNDFSFIYCHRQRITQLTEEAFHRYTIAHEHRDLLQIMLSLFSTRVESISHSKFILPTLYATLTRIRAAMAYPNRSMPSAACIRTDRFETKQCLTDQLLRHFIQTCQTARTRKGEYFLRDQNDNRITLKDYIAKTAGFDHIYWPEIFRLVELAVGEREQNQFKQEYLHNMPLEVNPNLQCLGCTQFFFHGHNVFTPTSKPKLVVLGSILSLPQTAGALKEEVCGLLNNKGGIILFGCEREYFNVIAKGDTILEDEKKNIEESIRNCLSDITPALSSQIEVSFVPLKEDPFKAKGTLSTKANTNQKYIERKFMEGQYVVRVKVTPSDGSRAYFYMRDGKPTFTVRKETLNNHSSSKQHFSGKDFSSFIKTKFNQFPQKDNAAASELWRTVTQFRDITHKCQQPHPGLPLSKLAPQQEGNPEEKYKYASVIVVKHSYHDVIRERFRSHRIEGQISVRFQNSKLRGAAGVALFYHSMRTEEIQNIIGGNKNFEFDGRPLMLMPITQHLRLSERNARNVMPERDFDSLVVWMRKEFKEGSIKMWKFITDQNDSEYYLETGSRAATLFLYLIMSTFNEKSQFKSPKALQSMSEREKQSRYRMIYTSH